ncbi:MAG TPA: hypothetical protein VGL62_01505 [Vicinamibacterales bacterium]
MLEKFAAVQMIDVHLPTTDGRELLLTRYTEPEPELSLLLTKLKLELPAQPPCSGQECGAIREEGRNYNGHGRHCEANHGDGPRAYPSVTKTKIYTEMAKRANATRRADETSEGAFARFATTTDDGRALLAAYKVAGGEDYRPSSLSPTTAEPAPTSAAYQKLVSKAEELRQIHPELSEAQAFSKVYEAPENRELVDADRAAFQERAVRPDLNSALEKVE